MEQSCHCQIPRWLDKKKIQENKMSLISILLLLLAFGVAVWVVGRLCYKKGHDAGYEERRTEEWIEKVRKYKDKTK